MFRLPIVSILALAANSFGFAPLPQRTIQPFHLYRDDYSEPYFETHQIPTSTTAGPGLDHVVDCAENGNCSVEEMMAMIEELEQLNEECEDSHELRLSRKCNLQAVQARNILKVSLASKVMLEHHLYNEDECDFNAMYDMDDLCYDQIMHGIPTVSMQESSLDRLIQCAEYGECPVDEMAEMIEELDRLNHHCEGTNNLSRECSLEAREARNMLKVALGAQAVHANATL